MVKELLELSSENIWSKSHWAVLLFVPPPLLVVLLSVDWEDGLVLVGDRTPPLVPAASLLGSPLRLYEDDADTDDVDDDAETDEDEDLLDDANDGGGTAFPAGVLAVETDRDDDGDDDDDAGELLLDDDSEPPALDKPDLWLNHCDARFSFALVALVTVCACADEKDDDVGDPAVKEADENGAADDGGVDVELGSDVEKALP